MADIDGVIIVDDLMMFSVIDIFPWGMGCVNIIYILMGFDDYFCYQWPTGLDG